jgi:hypothetical protein
MNITPDYRTCGILLIDMIGKGYTATVLILSLGIYVK